MLFLKRINQILIRIFDQWLENLHEPKKIRWLKAFLIIGAIYTGAELIYHAVTSTRFFFFTQLLYFPIVISAFIYKIYGGIISGFLAGIIVNSIIFFDFGSEIFIINYHWLYIFLSYVFVGLFLGTVFSYLNYQKVQVEELNENRLYKITSALGEGTYIVNKEGKLIFMNSEAERLLGWKEEELYGKNMHDFIHYETLEGKPISADQCPILKQVISGDIYHSNEEFFIRKDRSKFPVIYKATEISIDKEYTGYLIAFYDITDLKHTRMNLQHNTNELERYKIALDSHAIVTKTDKNGVILDVNDKFCEISQFSREELIGSTHRIVNSNYHSKEYFENLWNTIKSGEIWKGEIVNRKKDGSLYWVDASIIPFLNEDRQPYQYIAIRNDITERKIMESSLQQAKEEAERANRAKSEFLSRMSHELRTPMNAILGFAQLLESDPIDPLTESQQENVDEILKAGKHLLTLINEILDLSRIESGKISLSLETIDVPSVIRSSLSLIQPMAEKHNIRLEKHFNNEVTYFVKADQTRLQQVLLNLLSNSIKYNHENGTVQIECAPISGQRLRISIIDTGIGIPPEKEGELFQPFSRLGVEGKGIEGTGIGLNLSKRLVELMNGRIGYESQVDEGTHFYVELPLADYVDLEKKNLELIQPPVIEGKEIRANVRTLIYIEDNPANVELVSRILRRRADIKFIYASTAKLGLDLIYGHDPDLVLLDIHLPDMNGFELLKILKMKDQTKGIPVVALSANAMVHDIEKGLNAGFYRYLTKPINVKDFLETIDELFNERREDHGDSV